MSRRESNPPTLALWLLRHACPGNHRQALAGDLVEQYSAGRSPAWFWKQVLVAMALGALSELRWYWPYFCYAMAGMAMPAMLGRAVYQAPGWLHWWTLPWPWSMLAREVTPAAIFALTALAPLAIALALNGAFRWRCIFQTGLLSVVLAGLAVYLPDVPWLMRPVPGDPYSHTMIWPEFFLLLRFLSFFISAVLGCRSGRERPCLPA